MNKTDSELEQARCKLIKQIDELKREIRQVTGEQRKRALIIKAENEGKSMTQDQRDAVIQTLQAEGIKSKEAFGKIK